VVIKIYDNKILSPVKCGTRHLDKIWLNKRVEYTHNDYLRFPKVKYIIVRSPLEHLITALHTETVGYINEFGKVIDFYHQLNDFISPIGATHWSTQFYKYLYYYRNRYGSDVEVVELSNLTTLLQNLGYDLEYNSEEYNFKKYEHWWEKNELFDILKETYPQEIKWLLEKVEEQNVYYNKLLNNETDNNLIGNLI
jgi:hypothetical protein